MNRAIGLSILVLFAVAHSSFANDDLIAFGASAFSDCDHCHVVGGPATNLKPAPHLNKLVGRTPGGLDEAVYSLAMVRFGDNHVWDEQTLTAFLRDPQKVVPGTNMRFGGIKDDERIRALLAYLATFN